MKRRSVLGRGLNALLQENEDLNFQVVNIEDIVINQDQPRKNFDDNRLDELTESIKEHGIIVPITLKKQKDNKYFLIAGERRYRASIKAGLKTIPCFLREGDDEKILQMALVENIQRENLNPIEIASSLKRLIDECDTNQADLAKKIGKKRSTISNFLRILKLPFNIQLALKEKKISMGHAKAIMNIENIEELNIIFHNIIRNGISVRKTEELVKISKKKKEKKTINFTDFEKYTLNLNEKLKKPNCYKINIKVKKKESGIINIGFNNKTELDKIINTLYKDENIS